MKKRWLFDDGDDGFRYDDDAFLFTAEPRYARGKHDDGALILRLGGRDDDRIEGMSGGWTKDFELDTPQHVELTFKYRVKLDADFEVDEFSDVRVAVDGDLVRIDGRNFVDRFYGEVGQKVNSGWREVTVDLGLLEAGDHAFTIGGYANQKTSASEMSKIYFDKVRIETADPAPPKLGDFEAEVLRLTNAFREENGRDPLRNDANLNASAEDWSREMAAGDFFEHSDKPGQIEEFGYDPDGWGENIAAGYQTPKKVVQGWIDSPGHRANLLGKDFEDIGIGYHYKSRDGGDAPYGHYWTQIFGTPDEDYLM